VYLIPFLILFFTVNGLYSPRTIRINIFRFFRERWLEIVLI